MAAATAALPMATLFGAAATGNILAEASVMAASGVVWVAAAVNRAPNHASGSRLGASPASGGHQGGGGCHQGAATPAAVTAAVVIRVAVVVIRVPPTPAAVTAEVIRAN